MRKERDKQIKRRERLQTFVGYILFLLTSLLSVSVAVPIYELTAQKSGGDPVVVSFVMFVVAMAFALLLTVVDMLRRRFTVEKQVLEIVKATDKIAGGDFSVRLPISHSLEQYSNLDIVKENLNKMTEELSKTEVLRTDFISSVSHEIKTPLSIIRNYAKALVKDDLDETARKRYAETLVGASERLTALVTNILKLNKLENLEILPEWKKIDLSESVGECVLAMEDLMERKSIELRCDIDEVFVCAPPDLLEIVWNNLLSNAVKFTNEGGRVEISLKKVNGFAVVSVSDTGCGIPASTGERIFEKFYQGDGSRANEGNGLGLALVKKVIDVCGGEIFVKSVVGKGSTFTVKLKAE
ncbi:MAG: HAMP domain-containing histidine kinase [Clostridia bacterium]|nr:HAMP domain-containing histidine kinase [Clostridia bacterium]